MTFTELKIRYHTPPKEPLYLPSLVADCDQCKRPTGTKVLFMRAGLGNACDQCGRLRRGKPYLSQHEFSALKPNAAKGGQYGKHT